jgi:hypothetical protein
LSAHSPVRLWAVLLCTILPLAMAAPASAALSKLAQRPPVPLPRSAPDPPPHKAKSRRAAPDPAPTLPVTGAEAPAILLVGLLLFGVGSAARLLWRRLPAP